MAAKRINLLPPELAAKRRGRQAGGAILMAGLALIALLAVIFLVQEVRLRSERGRLEAQQERNADLRAERATLAEFDRKEQLLQQKTQLLQQLTAEEVRWSVVLADISLVIPSDVWLTQFTGNVEDGGGGGEEDQPGIGGIQMAGNAFTHVDVARWLTRLSEVDSFAFPYLSLSAKSAIGEVSVVEFNSTVRLNERALRTNQRAGRRT